MTSDLKALRDIISSSVDKIVEVCESTGKPFPSLHEPIQFSEFTPDGIRNNPQVLDAIGLIVAAATQLVATVNPPPVTLTTSAFRFTLSSALGVVERANVAEILRSAGPKGLHVNEIATKTGTDPKKLSRILRYLATNHWFKETSPDVFAHNLLSSLLDTGKEITPDFAATKHKDSPGLAAIVGYAADEAIKAAACLPETITDPKTALSEEPSEGAVQRALKTNKTLWEYYDSPEGKLQGQRFGIVMAGANKLQPPEAVVTGFDWSTVPQGGLVVDVGCGLGHVSLEVAKVRPDLQIVLEDRSVVINEAKDYWKANLPNHVTEGKVHFIPTDFFGDQPKLPAVPDVFLLRQIVHDWSDKYAVKILQQLKKSAGPNTKLLIVDCVVDYACESPLSGQPAPPPMPAPLLPNLGGANLLTYSVDLVVMGVLNAGERTIGRFNEVIESSGWEFQEIRLNPGSKLFWPSIIAVPA